MSARKMTLSIKKDTQDPDKPDGAVTRLTAAAQNREGADNLSALPAPV
jgi:hypothetical protein